MRGGSGRAGQWALLAVVVAVALGGAALLFAGRRPGARSPAADGWSRAVRSRSSDAMPMSAAGPRPRRTPRSASDDAPLPASPPPSTAARLLVLVVDRDSRRPLAGVTVRARSGEGAASAETGSTGRAALAGLAPGRYRLEAIGPRHAPFRGEVQLWAVPRELEIALWTGHTVAGRVHLASGAPLEGVPVRVTAPTLPRGRSSETDADGRFEMRGLPSGPVDVEARPVGLSPVARRVSLVLPPGGAARREVDLSFRRGTLLRGRVVDGEGAPVPGAQIEVQVEGVFEPFACTGGADGRFRIDGLPGSSAQLRARLAGWSAGPPRALRLPGDGALVSVTLILRRAGVLTGRVLDERGRGFPSVRVEVRAAVGGKVRARAATDRAGRFRVDGLPAGRYTAHAVCPGYGPAASAPVDVRVGAASDVGALRLGRGASIRGVVRDGSGDPVAGVRVEVRRAGAAGFGEHAVTSPDGSFALHGFEAGEVSLRARRVGGSPGPTARYAVGPEGIDGVRLTLPGGAVVRGVVRTSAGVPVEDAWVVEVAQGARPARTDADGRFRLEAGGAVVSLLIHAPGYAPLQVVARPGVEVHARLQPADAASPATGLVIRGWIRRGPLPAAGVTVLVRRSPASSTRTIGVASALAATAVTDAAGRFAVSVNETGRYEVLLLSVEGGRERVRVCGVDVRETGAEVNVELGEAPE